jgi:hypothetical protein
MTLWIRIRIRIRIELNFWIRIWIRIESIRIHNPVILDSEFLNTGTNQSQIMEDIFFIKQSQNGPNPKLMNTGT